MVVNNQYLEGMVLSILSESEDGKHPYEIKSILETPLALSASTIYSVCKRLERKELIQADINSHIVQGRARKYYFITDKGREKLETLKLVYKKEKPILERWFGNED